MPDTPFRSGFVAIIGRPNVGKSTLLNQVLGEKVVITSDKPQTTRNRVQGIHNLPGAQIVFIDTPGMHNARSRLNQFMMEAALSSVKGVDVVLLLVDVSTFSGNPDDLLLGVLEGINVPVVLALNKIDLLPKEKLLEVIAAHARLYPFREIIPVSAASGDGVELLVKLLAGMLPEGVPYFPDDILTDLPERFIVAEMIREKVFRLTHDEVPYSTAVTIDNFKERADGLVSISAVITVERDSQKGIIIGKKGEMLKKIGRQARQEIEQLLDARVFLELFVKVSKDWRENRRMMKELGYE
ncbi:MAG: GTPase Era [Deltaproteobacteria bacterium]|nr:GTPase Era [Deltaproteobacteria bacterium]TLN05183.1 MAG: GTPase Era [bacterium]